jgi:hypothetical protein
VSVGLPAVCLSRLVTQSVCAYVWFDSWAEEYLEQCELWHEGVKILSKGHVTPDTLVERYEEASNKHVSYTEPFVCASASLWLDSLAQTYICISHVA